MSSLFIIFVLEIVALRVGKTYLAKHGIQTHTDVTHHVRLETELHQPIPLPVVKDSADSFWNDSSETTPPGAQILGVAILEFGILFHSVSN